MTPYRLAPSGDTSVLFLLKTTGSTIYDGSTYHSTITLSGGTAPAVSSTTAKWGSQSVKLDCTGGVTSYLTAPNAALSALSSTAAITIEFWGYIATAAAGSCSMGGLHGTTYVELGHAGSSRWLYGNTPNSGDQYNGFNHGSQAWPSATWKHFAMVRPAGSATTPRLYFDGAYKGAWDSAWNPDASMQAAVGASRNVSTNLGVQYIQDFRIKLGEEYTGTGSYTIPTATFPEY